MIIEALRTDETLGRELCLHGRVAFHDRANPSENTDGSLEESLEHLHVDDALPSRRQRRGRGRGRKQAQAHQQTRPARRRNRRADQFCVHVVANERQVPAYVVEFKAPHKLTEPELVAGLHEVELERDVIGREGDTFEFHATHLVSAVVTQTVSYMFDSGVRDGYICTGEAFVFLHIPEDPRWCYITSAYPIRTSKLMMNTAYTGQPLAKSSHSHFRRLPPKPPRKSGSIPLMKSCRPGRSSTWTCSETFRKRFVKTRRPPSIDHRHASCEGLGFCSPCRDLTVCERLP